LARIERGKSRWAIKAANLEKKEKEKEKEEEKEKEKEDKEGEKETSIERKFRIEAERGVGRNEWRAQINNLMTGRDKPEPKVRFDATDSPLSSNIEEGELDYLSQPGENADEESNSDNNNNN
jgi:hypothetical protein